MAASNIVCDISIKEKTECTHSSNQAVEHYNTAAVVDVISRVTFPAFSLESVHSFEDPISSRDVLLKRKKFSFFKLFSTLVALVACRRTQQLWKTTTGTFADGLAPGIPRIFEER